MNTNLDLQIEWTVVQNQDSLLIWIMILQIKYTGTLHVGECFCCSERERVPVSDV